MTMIVELFMNKVDFMDKFDSLVSIIGNSNNYYRKGMR